MIGRCLQQTCMSAMPLDWLLMAVPVGLRSLLSQRHHRGSTRRMLHCHSAPLLFILIRPTLPSMSLPQTLSITRRLGSAMSCAMTLVVTLACARALLRYRPFCCASMCRQSMVPIMRRLHCCMAAHDVVAAADRVAGWRGAAQLE